MDDLVLQCEGDRMWVENTETGDVLGLITKLSLAAWRSPSPNVN